MIRSASAVVTLGPLAFSAGVVALLGGIVVALAINGWWRRRGRVSVESALWLSLLVSLVIARMVFVLRWWPEYVAQPWSMLNVRDGGFPALPTLLALAVMTALIAWRRPPWRGALAWSAGGGILVWGFISLTVQKLEATTQMPLPNIVLHDVDGHSVDLQQLDGKPTVLNLWATWCEKCRREMQTLARAFLGAQKLHLDHVVIDSGMQLSQYYNIRGYPSTLFLDAQGHLRDVHMGELSPATLAESLGRVTDAGPSHSGESP
jgi:thiol-disulfide isomerase/thioredoxin